MRYVILVALLSPAIALGLAVVIATTDGTLESPYHPAALLPIVANDFRAAATAASELLRDLLDGFTAPYRERIPRTLPTEPPPR
jgi:hypothetical protein